MRLIAGGIIFCDRQVLLVKHKKLGIWMHPAGHVEASETFDEALTREIKEETGLIVTIISAVESGVFEKNMAIPFSIHQREAEIILDYICTTNEKSITLQEEELEEHMWISEEQLSSVEMPKPVRNLIKKAFEILPTL